MINKKTAVILIFVIVLLCALTAFVFMSDTSDTNDGVGENIADVVSVYSGDADKLVSVKVTTPDEEYLVLNTENGPVLSGAEAELVKTYSLESLFRSVSNISAKSVVEENSSNLEQYGLKNTKYTVTAQFEDVKKTFYAGDKTAMADGYYFKDADTSVVYTVTNGTFSSLFRKKTNYLDSNLLKINADKLTKIKIKKDGFSMSLKLMDEPIIIDGYTLANWEMTEPYKLPLDTSQFSESILQNIVALGADEIVSDSGDFSAYGLSKPYAVVTLEDLDGVTQILNISAPNGEKCYISSDNSKVVYRLDASSVGFVDAEPLNIVSKFANIVYIDDTEKIVVKSSNEEYTLSVSDTPQKTYMFNGNKVDEKRFKQELYQPVIGLVCSGFCTDAVYSSAQVTIDYYMANKDYSKIEFVNYDDRNYAVFKDGKCIFKILKKDVNNMLNAMRDFK